MAVNWLYYVLKRGKTRIEGDTLGIEGVEYVDAAGATVQAAAFEAAGGRVDRLSSYEFPEIDISAAGATLVGPIFPVAGEVLRAYAVVTEAIENVAITTATIALGAAKADGTTSADVDAVVDEIAPAKGAAVGTVVPLTIVDGAVAAGEVLTATHATQAIAGKVKIVVEYVLG